jgi:hypothetical protein
VQVRLPFTTAGWLGLGHPGGVVLQAGAEDLQTWLAAAGWRVGDHVELSQPARPDAAQLETQLRDLAAALGVTFVLPLPDSRRMLIEPVGANPAGRRVLLRTDTDVRVRTGRMSASVDQTSYAALGQYLRTGQPPDGFYDLALHDLGEAGLGLGRRDGTVTPVTVEEVVALLAQVPPELEIRLLVDRGMRYEQVLRAIATAAERDFLVAPADGVLGVQDGQVVVQAGEHGPVLDWQRVRPEWMHPATPTRSGSTGPMVLALPHVTGLAWPTAATFMRAARLAAAALTVRPSVLTLILGIDPDHPERQFLLGDYGGGSYHADGTQFGQHLLTQLPADVTARTAETRLVVDWPADDAGRQAVRDQIRRLALQTGWTVWAPAPGHRVVPLASAGDIAVVGPDGNPGGWEAYIPDQATGQVTVTTAPPNAASTTDPDGRLMPVGWPLWEAAESVLMSLPPGTPEEVRQAYRSVRGEPDVVLAASLTGAGLLALTGPDGSVLPAGPRTLERVLRAERRYGLPIRVVVSVTAGLSEPLTAHLAALAEHLLLGFAFPRGGLGRPMVTPERRLIVLATGGGQPQWAQVHFGAQPELVVPRSWLAVDHGMLTPRPTVTCTSARASRRWTCRPTPGGTTSSPGARRSRACSTSSSPSATGSWVWPARAAASRRSPMPTSRSFGTGTKAAPRPTSGY